MDADFQAQELFSEREARAELERDYAAFQEDVKAGFFAEDGQPLKCKKCKHKRFTCENTDHIANVLCEFDEHCVRCAEFAAHWSYGQYQGPTL